MTTPVPVVNNSTSLPSLALTRRMPMLSSALRSKVFERESNEYFKSSSCSMQGFRHTMEDRHNQILSLDKHPNFAFFSVFDGHNGELAAHFLKHNLFRRIDALEDIRDNDAIIDTVLDMDREFCATPDGSNGSTMVFALVETVPIGEDGMPLPLDDVPSNKRQSSDASNSSDKTVIMDVDEEIPPVSYRIRVFYAGDSRGVVGRFEEKDEETLSDAEFVRMLCDEVSSNRPTREVKEETPPNLTNKENPIVGVETVIDNAYRFTNATTDHKPNVESERTRIMAAGGRVHLGRVNGHLAVARAFGDSNFKHGVDGNHPVTARCEVTELTAREGDFLFLFCDGLVEKMDSNQVVRSLYNETRACRRKMFHAGRTDVAYGLANVFETALDTGSTDNMTAVFVQFKDGGDYSLECGRSTYLPGPLFVSRHDARFMKSFLTHAAKYGHYDSEQIRRAAYKEDIRMFRSGSTCHNLMKDMLDVTEDAIKSREKRRKSNLRYIVEIENKLDQMRAARRRMEESLPKQKARHSGSTEIYSEGDFDSDSASDTEVMDDARDGSETPRISSDDDDDMGEEEKNSKLIRRVTDYAVMGLRRSDSMVLPSDWGSDNARGVVIVPVSDDEDDLHSHSNFVPLDSACNLSPQSSPDIESSIGRKRRRMDDEESDDEGKDEVVGEEKPPNKKRRIEVDHETWAANDEKLHKDLEVARDGDVDCESNLK